MNEAVNQTSQMALAGYDIFIIILYMVGMMVMGAYYSRYVDSSEDFFLSGKRLPWWSIGMSLVSTDISAVDYLGAAGIGYAYGIVVANFDWIGCLPPLILAAFIFMPYFWRAGIYTIPEYLGRRFNQYVRMVHALLWGLFLICNLAVILWATGKMFVEFVPIGDGFLWGSAKAVFTSNQWWAPHWQIMVWIFIVAFVVAFYTISGGISAVTMTDVAQLILMFVGGAAVIVVGLYKIGGIAALKTTVTGTVTCAVVVAFTRPSSSSPAANEPFDSFTANLATCSGVPVLPDFTPTANVSLPFGDLPFALSVNDFTTPPTSTMAV